MAIVFLDFDGVLHPEGALPGQRFGRVPVFCDWLRARPDVRVVIASTWRVATPFEQLVALFEPDVRDQVTGRTPLFQDVDPPPGTEWLVAKREAECRAWLQARTDGSHRWAALDDMPALFRPGCRELVVCDGRIGFTVEDGEALDRVLGLASS